MWLPTEPQGFPDDLAKLLPSIYPPAVISVDGLPHKDCSGGS